MKTNLVRRAPLFVFRGIDPKEITEKYFEGEYNDAPIPDTRIKMSDVFHVITPSYGTSPEEPRYQYKDKNNSSIVILTTNSKNYEVYKRSSHFEDYKGDCFWCLQYFDHEPCLIPIKHQQRKVEDKTYEIFWTTNVYCCTPSCAMAWCEREAIIDHLYVSALEHCKLLYSFLYPKEIIQPAPHYKLLDKNKGTMTTEEFYKNKYRYQKTSNIIFLPAKEEFIQSQIS